MSLCRQFRALPEAGGVLDQPVWLLTMQAILAHTKSEVVSVPLDDEDLFAGIPMEVLR